MSKTENQKNFRLKRKAVTIYFDFEEYDLIKKDANSLEKPVATYCKEAAMHRAKNGTY